MQSFTAEGSVRPSDYEKTTTARIIRENIQPYSRTEEDGSIIEGFTWKETRLTPEEAYLIEQGKGLYAQQNPSNAVKIVYYRGRLADTDYIIAKIAEAEGVEAQALRETYANLISQRKQWRAELNSL